MKAIIYCRKSTESEERQTQSLEAQINWCREYSITNSFEVVEEIIESKTAKKPGREGFNKMIQMFSENKAEVIVTWQLNRISRNPIDEGTVKWFTQQGIIKQIHSTDGIADGSNILTMSIHFAMATQYVIDLKRNVERGMKQKLEKGGICTKVPMGYLNDKNTKTAVINEEKCDWVKEIFKLRIQGMQYHKIGKTLFEKGLKTKFGNPLSKSTIEGIIKNEFYVGIMSFSGEKFPGTHELFISQSDFNEANRDRRRFGKRDTSFENGFYIKEKLFYKGKKMSPYQQKGYIYYKQGFGIKEPINIAQNDILTAFSEHIKYYTVPSIILKDLSSSIQKYTKDLYKENKKNYEKLKKSIEEIRERKSRLLDVRLAGVLSDQDFKKKNEELMRRDLVLQEELKNINYADTEISNEASELLEVLTNLPNIYKNSYKVQQGYLIDMIASELILVNKKELKIQENKLFEIIKNLNMSYWWS